MPNAPFGDRLTAAVRRTKCPIVVGLDPRKESLPAGMLPTSWGDEVDAIAQAFRSFCCGVIDVVADLVPAVKLQCAFFEQLGPVGMRVLCQVVDHARHRRLLVILDAKRNDIGSTAEAYARGYLGATESAWKGDALTVSPYLGRDSLEPFFRVAQERDSGVFVLVKTSNPGGGLLQDLSAGGKTVYEYVAAFVESCASETCGESGYGAVGAVVGATYPDQLASLRQQMPHAWLLVPGFGAEGATAADVVGAFDDHGLGAIVNSSRAIIFAHARDEYRQHFGDANWQAAVETATRDMMEQLRAETTTCRL